MLRDLHGGVTRDIPGQWARWKHMPDTGTIVHILATGWLTNSEDDFLALPGGFFAEVTGEDLRNNLSKGYVSILTVPQSLMTLPIGSVMPMLECAAWLRAPSCDHDAMRLEVVPDDVQTAILTFIQLQISTGAESLPLVVEDGWLC